MAAVMLSLTVLAFPGPSLEAAAAVPSAIGTFTPVVPARILDTRDGTGRGGDTAKVGPDRTITANVRGVGGLPAGGVSAVVMNVTATEPTAAGFLSVTPQGGNATSSLNLTPGQDVANLVSVPVGSDGNVRVYNNAGSTHVVFDVVGWFAPSEVTVQRVSVDPYDNTTSQHQTEVEPDTYAFDDTVVSAFQVGRFFDGGASNIGWATSSDGGGTWSNGFLPGLTVFSSPAGPYSRASDPAVAYDARHGTWLVNSLGLQSTPSVIGSAVTVNRSTDGGRTWGNAINVAATASGSYDKNWIVCDNHQSSPYYGNCYVTWDDNAVGNRLLNATSTDGGLTWGPATPTVNTATGLGGQPVVQPNGTVVVPSGNANLTAIVAYQSNDGGASWTAPVTVTGVQSHVVAGGLRSPVLPSAEVDGSGKVYVAWQDCRFRAGCSSNDVVYATSANGTSWSSVQRVPIDAVDSTVDHFIPGLGVNPSTAGATAQLGLTYYWYPSAGCTFSTCQLNVGFISSSDGGGTWSTPVRVSRIPMSLSWVANTSQGRMVGDYISTSFVNGVPTAVITLADANDTSFREAMYAAQFTVLSPPVSPGPSA